MFFSRQSIDVVVHDAQFARDSDMALSPNSSEPSQSKTRAGRSKVRTVRGKRKRETNSHTASLDRAIEHSTQASHAAVIGRGRSNEHEKSGVSRAGGRVGRQGSQVRPLPRSQSLSSLFFSFSLSLYEISMTLS